MQHEVVEKPVDQTNGCVEVPDEPGLGIAARDDVVQK
jgi:L-alanine-DL-glutamate epimerase-like enolase superfamily enzyme